MRRRTVAVAGAVLLVMAGAVLVWHGLSPSFTPPSLPAPAAVSGTSSPDASAAPVTAARDAAVKAIPRSVPKRIVIPAIGVNAPIAPEGTDASGALEMPPLSAKNLTAWWDGGVTPGQDGPAVIAGHVDNTSGPLVFWRLRELKPGDTVTIDPAGVTFMVTAVTQVDKTSFPTDDVYGTEKDPELRLITCGGTFDAATGHYLSNLIVYATETKA